MKYLLLLTLLVSGNAWALTKSQALQLSKSRIETLSRKFQTLSYSCFVYDQDCFLDNDLQGIVLKLITNEASKHPTLIQYASGKEQFLIDGAVRIAKTGKSWGVPVIFNEDLLVREITPGNYEALDFFEVIGILVHEFGHHQEDFYVGYTGKPFLRHEELDHLAAKVVKYLKDRTRKLEITQDEIADLPKDHNITIYQIDIEQNIGVRLTWSNIFIDSLFETKEVSADLVIGVVCPKNYTNGHLTFLGEPANAAFRQVRAPRFTSAAGALTISQEIGDASVLCVDQKMGRFEIFNGYKNGRVQYEFKLRDGKYLYSYDSRFYATPPPDNEYR